MANQSYFFDHDYSSRNDDKILEMRSVYKAEGYGVFWMLIETMAEREDGRVNTSLIGGLSLGYGVAKDWLSEFIKYCVSIDLLTESEGYVYSKRMLSHKELMTSYADYGRQGAEKRWGGYRGANGGANAKRVEREEKEIRENKVFGISFSEDKKSVTLNDGTIQALDLDQLRLMKEGGYPPHRVKKSK